MPNYQYEMSIEAASEKEATAKMQALTVLASKLSEKEITRLAHIVKTDPVKTALAKKYLGV
jgi:hypothetical protein